MGLRQKGLQYLEKSSR